jgi:hypothetical protein
MLCAVAVAAAVAAAAALAAVSVLAAALAVVLFPDSSSTVSVLEALNS